VGNVQEPDECGDPDDGARVAASAKTCPGCLGSGRVRDIDVVNRTSKVRTCDVCRGSGRVQGDVTCPPVRYSGTVHVINPGDPGYEEAKRRLEQHETN